MTEARQASSLQPGRAELLTRAATAARELCELLWEDLHLELRDPRQGRVKELSERLAAVSSTVALLAGGTPAAATPDAATAEQGPKLGPSEPSAAQPLARDARQERRIQPEPIWTERSEPSPHEGPPPPPPIQHPAAHVLRTDPSAQTLRADPAEPARMRLVDEHEHSATATLQSPPQPARESAPVRQTRREQGASAWVNTVGRLLSRHALDGLPFAVLLVELVDIARIEHSEPPAELTRLVSQVENALTEAMRAEDDLTRESLGRYWLVAPETNGTGARMLAERLARLVRDSATHRGVPLEVAIGIAVCPEDGCDAPELAARADLSVYSARATGQPVARAEPPR